MADIPVNCKTCKHYYGDNNCRAYPYQIPQDILCEEFEHTVKHEGDGGITYERSPDFMVVDNFE